MSGVWRYMRPVDVSVTLSAAKDLFVQPQRSVLRDTFSPMRIVSMLPSATEILFALGLGDSVAGVTFECDYPPEARAKQIVVRTRLSESLSAAEIDSAVAEFIARGESLYTVDAEALRVIEPDLVLTQDLCHVCAASPGDLAAALAGLPHAPRVVSLEPRTLTDVWNDILTVGELAGRSAEAQALIVELERRVAAVAAAVAGAPQTPRVLCMEWLDPPYTGGHWVPEMVAKAGGKDVLGRVGEPSFRVRWEEILAARPEAIVAMPCGYHLEQVMEEFAKAPLPAGWEDLPAVRAGRVFAVDASSYFSRPGPRLAVGIEILAAAIHPQRLPVVPSGALRYLSGSAKAQAKPA